MPKSILFTEAELETIERAMDDYMCYEPVHDLVRVCTSNHAYTISSLYAHNPHYAQLVEI